MLGTEGLLAYGERPTMEGLGFKVPAPVPAGPAQQEARSTWSSPRVSSSTESARRYRASASAGRPRMARSLARLSKARARSRGLGATVFSLSASAFA
jgi:hypothetical protein